MSSDSVQAIMDLTMVNQTIQLAIMIAMETNETLNQVTVLADMLMEDNITRQANMLLDASQSHYQELITLNNTVTGRRAHTHTHYLFCCVQVYWNNTRLLKPLS